MEKGVIIGRFEVFLLRGKGVFKVFLVLFSLCLRFFIFFPLFRVF